MTTIPTLHDFVAAYEAYDGDDLDAFLAEWTRRLDIRSAESDSPLATTTLNSDITAQMLALDSTDDPLKGSHKGYRPTDVIGPAGSTVTVIEVDGDHWLLVKDFANDPYAEGYVLRADTDYEG